MKNQPAASSTRATGRRASLVAALALLALLAAPGEAQAQGYAEAFVGCWVPEVGAGDFLALQPSGSYLHAGEVGTWTARADRISMRPDRELTLVWSVSMAQGVLTLDAPVERRRSNSGSTTESAPDRSRQMVLRRGEWSTCGTQPRFNAPEENEPPLAFVPTEPSIVLTNRLRNDPVEVRLADSAAPVVCEIVESVCHPVAAGDQVFSATVPGLLPGESVGATPSTVRVWLIRGGGPERGDLTRLDGQACAAEDAEPCNASPGYLLLVFDEAGAARTGRLMLGSTRDPAFEQALVVPGSRDRPTAIWIETKRESRGRGEYLWEGFRVAAADDGLLQVISIAGPFQSGALQAQRPRRLDNGGTEECVSVARNEPVIDEVSGSVSLITDIALDPADARQLVLGWNAQTGRYQATTARPGPAPATETTCAEVAAP